MTFDYPRFRAWKTAMARRDLAKARAARLRGDAKLAAWFLALAGMARASLVRDAVREAAR